MLILVYISKLMKQLVILDRTDRKLIITWKHRESCQRYRKIVPSHRLYFEKVCSLLRSDQCTESVWPSGSNFMSHLKHTIDIFSHARLVFSITNSPNKVASCSQLQVRLTYRLAYLPPSQTSNPTKSSPPKKCPQQNRHPRKRPNAR